MHQIEDTLNTTKEVNLKTEFITLDAPVNPGNSGGGFFDSNGKLAPMPNTTSLFAVPSPYCLNVTIPANLPFESKNPPPLFPGLTGASRWW